MPRSPGASARQRVRRAMANTPPGRALVSRHDHKALVELIRRAGYVDLEWYRIATGEPIDSDHEAVEHYLAGASPMPLSPLLAATGLGQLGEQRSADNDPVLRYLLRGNVDYLPGPMFDDHAYLAAEPAAAAHPGRARGHFLSTARGDSILPTPTTWIGPPVRWDEWRARMIELVRAINDRARQPMETGWDELGRGLPARPAGRVSILIPTIGDWRLTNVAVGALLRHRGGRDLEIVVVDNGSPVPTALGLAQSIAAHDPGSIRTKAIWLPENRNFAGGTNTAFAQSTGATVVLLNNDTAVQAGWLEPLLAELTDPDVVAVQPLLRYGDGTVQTAGTAFPDCGGLPSHLLVAHPPEDARQLGRFDVSAVTAAAMAMRAADYCRLTGLDEEYENGYEDVDLCLRALAAPRARLRVATDSEVVHFESRTRADAVVESNRDRLWSTWRDRLPPPDLARLLRVAGFDVLRWDPGRIKRAGLGRIPLPVITPRVDPDAPDGHGNGSHPALRWALKVPWRFDPVGPAQRAETEAQRDRAVELAAALRRRGQTVVVDPIQAHQRFTSGLDDAVLVLAPLAESFEPQPGRPNIVWDPGGADEAAGSLSGFDIRAATPAPAPGDARSWEAVADQLINEAVAWRSAHVERIGAVSPRPGPQG